MRFIFSVRLADVLTVLRIIAAPVVIWLIVIDETLAAYYLFGAAAITDYLDGYFARRSKKLASYGEAFDGLADLVLVYGTIITLFAIGEAFWFSVFTFSCLVWATIVVMLISRKRTRFTIIHLDTNILAAIFYPTIMTYIIGWQYAWVLFIIFIVVGLATGINYSLYVRRLYRQET
jgi:phosphatidylglycerophosphate synthase